MLSIQTELGDIKLKFRDDAAPETVAHIRTLVEDKLYDGCNFYRADFVIQCGLHGSGKNNPHSSIKVNETHTGTFISNTRGTASVAHWDVPDNGNSEFFRVIFDNS